MALYELEMHDSTGPVLCGFIVFGAVMVWLAHMPENCGDMHVDPMMGSGRLL